ncbi:hypothetical protein GSI_11146 [Ganoderma sinense ZZ0214-1]|uniref:Uncharacterized protein n=1 Tax=Ganoderma sinense ZZ0214-1 TaxID=1077348 RepID=A0A2G8RYZ1_9APHY|nr:hypothetical protein GSI_11146 [Ganoderma sinense ZZ0214-1]
MARKLTRRLPESKGPGEGDPDDGSDDAPGDVPSISSEHPSGQTLLDRPISECNGKDRRGQHKHRAPFYSEHPVVVLAASDVACELVSHLSPITPPPSSPVSKRFGHLQLPSKPRRCPAAFKRSNVQAQDLQLR